MKEDRKFMVEVTIFHPNGEDLDNWRIVSRLNEEVSEQYTAIDSLAIGNQIAASIEKYCDTKSVASPKS